MPSSCSSKLVGVALAAAIAASGAVATTALTVATAATAQAASSVGGQITRSEVLARAKSWVDQAVPYSQVSYHTDGSGTLYRQDCSGFVSMAWHINTSGTNSGFTTNSAVNYSTRLAGLDSLKPGDTLNNINTHMVLFVGWNDSGHTSATIYEEPNSDSTARSRVMTRSDMTSGGFLPYRYNNIVDDPSAPVYSGDVPVSGKWGGSASTIGVFRDGVWALRNSNSAGSADVVAGFGKAGDVPITGDWDGLGHDQLGVYRPSTREFVLRHDDASSNSLVFGNAGDVPVPGMWDHNGHAQMAVYRPSTATFTVRHDDGTTTSAPLGNPGDTPIVGDWDGVGHTQMGVFRAGTNPGDANTFALRHDDGTVTTATYGEKGDLPVVGDWSAKGRTTFGVYRPGTATFALSNAYTSTADYVFKFGNGGTWS
ncbi:hypothetical protein [Kitasatospora sp. NPDC090308]|uniref:hypothetical protein n=1 Tax=Kitasatospora sp. NPDC090308 TaxID=3364082 RepID=UPI00381DD9DB